jgi:uncharacterized membrane-anchored protein
VCDRFPSHLALGDGKHIDRNGDYAEGRNFLLGDNHVLPDFGDWVADTNEIGYLGAAADFGGLLLLTALLYYLTSFSRVILFWAAFILTRPLGATLGDFLDKPIAEGGLALSRYSASLALLVVIVALILILPQKPASKAH